MALATSADLTCFAFFFLIGHRKGDFDILTCQCCRSCILAQPKSHPQPPHVALFWQQEASHGYLSVFPFIFALSRTSQITRRATSVAARTSTSTRRFRWCNACDGRTVPCRSFLGLGVWDQRMAAHTGSGLIASSRPLARCVVPRDVGADGGKSNPKPAAVQP